MQMYASDFEYDGRLLSSFGFMVCTFGGSGDLDVAETGYDITFTKVQRNHGRRNGVASTKYEDCAKTTFQICKNPSEYDDVEIRDSEYRELARWLNRHEFLRFRILSEASGLDRAPCYFNASFNIKKVYVADILYGLELTAETDSPYGYGMPVDRTWTVGAGGSITIADMSDDVGWIRPDLEITCLAGGTLSVSNQKLGGVTQIKNCVDNETINIYGDTQIITTSVAAHRICNDFNYEFPKIGNDYNGRTNQMSFSLPCTVRVRYAPVIKDIP